MLDEGAYLYKGLLFVKGIYRPFQDFGPWTNKGPFAFLIPGWFQELFGAGLRTGRVLAVVLGVLALIGLWMTARRLGNGWWAAAVVWGLALNPALIKTYSLAISQGLVACFLVWSLALTLGNNRKPWQLITGTVLAVIMVFTRQNMAPVLPLLVLYIFWQHGKRMGWITLAVGVVLFLAGHAIYWPNIMWIWLPWLPARLTPFFDFLRLQDGGISVFIAEATWIRQLRSVLQAIRYNFLPLVGLLLLILLFPLGKAARSWKKHPHFRTAVFLVVLQTTLVLMHAWASLSQEYCLYCFALYMGFFAPLTFLILVVMLSSLEKRPTKIRSSLIILVVLGLFTGIGYGSFEEYGYQLRGLFMDIMAIKTPRFKDFFNTWKFQPGTASLEALIENKFNVVIDPYVAIENYRRIIPLVVGLLFGLLFLLVVYLVFKFLKKRTKLTWHYAALLLILFTTLGSLIAPTRFLGGGKFTYDCDMDSLSTYERTGKQMAEIIPTGSRVYWDVASSSTSLLLYLPDIQLYPQQINDIYSYHVGGDTHEILRWGQWNDEAAAQWLEEADFIVIEEPAIETGWKEVVSAEYEKVTITDPVFPCTRNQMIDIYRKMP
ncbi:ArnT family glycosyltransferase [Chloroflexota bacterium]